MVGKENVLDDTVPEPGVGVVNVNVEDGREKKKDSVDSSVNGSS